MKIKLILALVLVLFVALAVWHVQGLRADNASLSAHSAQLLAVNVANVALIQGLQAQRAQDELLLQQWVNDHKRIKQLQNQLTKQIERELQNNEDFKNWAGGALPDSVLRLALEACNQNKRALRAFFEE